MSINRRDAFLHLYHVSPVTNRISILNQGILVFHRKIWLFSWCKLSWALRHVATHHDQQMSNMDTYSVSIHRELLRRQRRGIFCTYYNIPTEDVCIL